MSELQQILEQLKVLADGQAAMSGEIKSLADGQAALAANTDKRFNDLSEDMKAQFRNVNERQAQMAATIKQNHESVINTVVNLTETMGGMIDENSRRVAALERKVV